MYGRATSVKHRVAQQAPAPIDAGRRRPAAAKGVLHDDGPRDRVGNGFVARLVELQAHVIGATLPAFKRKPQLVPDALVRVAALGKIQLRDALIATLGVAPLVRGPKHRLLRQQALGADRDTATVERLRENRYIRAVERQRGNATGVFGRRTLDVGGKRHAIAHQRACRERVHADHRARLGARRGRGITRGESARTYVEPGVAAEPVDTRARRDLDAAPPDVVELGRKGVTPNDDAGNLIPRRQAPAGEAVDADGGAGTGNLLEHALQLVRIVRQLIDFRLAQRLGQPAGFGRVSG